MIARLAIEVFSLLGVTVGLACATWMVSGGPRQEEGCHSAELKPGYLCFEDALKLSNVVWVDARTRELWQKNGYPNSVLLTDHPSEDFPSLMAEAFESLVTADSVVVYCATEGCGSSEPVAAQIRELDLIPAAQIYVLAGGWKALPQK